MLELIYCGSKYCRTWSKMC